MVQMVAEEVIIDVGATKKIVDMGEAYAFLKLSGYQVGYNCTFWMVNQGGETESMAVRFPIRSQYEVGAIDILSIKVNGKPVSWQEDEVDWHEDFNWAHFDVTFPPGEEVEIKVTYTSLTQLISWTNPLVGVSYILETGAGWYGPIGKGRIILRTPYAASEQNVVLSERFDRSVFTGTDVEWAFADLEPDRGDNFYATVVSPDVWAEIEAARDKLEGSPNNISAHIRLAEAIFSICVYDRSQMVDFLPELYPEGLQAMANAVRLDPDDIELHERYAWFLTADLTPENYQLLLEEFEIIESLEPGNEELAHLREAWPLREFEINSQATDTPQPTNIIVSTETIAPTETLLPPTDTPLPTSTPLDRTELPRPTDQPNPEMPRSSFPNGLILLFGGLGLMVLLFLVIWKINKN